MAGKIGVLALQGDYVAHILQIPQEYEAVEVRAEKDLRDLRGLIFPGGESTSMLKLLDFREAVVDTVRRGLPVLATCAGTILLAHKVASPEQDSLQLLDVDVQRNAYGRQVDSHLDNSLSWTTEGQTFIKNLLGKSAPENVEGVFIRAPLITRVGSQVTALLKQGDRAVLVQQENIIAATFHPELVKSSSFIHEVFTKLVEIQAK